MVIAQNKIHAEGRKRKMMRFDWSVREMMKANPNTVLIVKVNNIDEHLFLLHGFNINVDDDINDNQDNFPYEYPCYLYIRKSSFRDGYYRTFDKNDVYSTLNRDVYGNLIIRREIINDPTPKGILLDTIDKCKSKDGYAACVVVDDGENYFAIDDNTLVGDYGYIDINYNLDDELNFLDSDDEPNGQRITKIFTAKIESFGNYSNRNTVWIYDEDEDLARYCNEHNITPEDLVKYFGIKIDK